MHRRLWRLVFVVVLLASSLVGAVVAPDRARVIAQNNDFTAAQKVISETGTIGRWAFAEPPGFPPVQCEYPVNETSLQLIRIPGPVVFPIAGIAEQVVSVEAKRYRRLPNGSMGSPISMGTSNGTASSSNPLITGPYVGPQDLGSTFVATVKIRWFDAALDELGSVEVLFTQYQTMLIGDSGTTYPVADACKPPLPATAALDASQGIVNQSIGFQISRFPHDPAVSIYFDGKLIGTVATGATGFGAGSLKVPAAPMGRHTFTFYRFGRTASAQFIVKPRIKLIPTSGLARGDTVNVSLRGFVKQETVRIRWKNSSGSWIQIAQVLTSSTGSANVNVQVPSFAVIGANSVRGDGNKGGAAQTNAVNVVVSASSSLPVKATPSPTPEQTATPEPTSTADPASPAPEPTSTPAQPVATETPTALPVTETPSPISPPEGETATPILETQTPEPTETTDEPVVPGDQPAATHETS